MNEAKIEKRIREPYGRKKVGLDFPYLKGHDIYNELFESTKAKRITVYNFWFASCAPCIAEIPMLMQLKEKYKNKVDFISVTYEDKEAAQRIAKKFNFNYRHVLLEKNKIEELKITSGYPTTVIVVDGKIMYCRHGGSTPDATNFDKDMMLSLKVYSSIIEKHLK